MKIRPSLRLAKKLHCKVTQLVAPQEPALDSWSGDLLTLRGAGSHALMMNDATLCAVIVPLDGVREFSQFLPRFLNRVSVLWANYGGTFDPRNQSIFVLKRDNRSYIGSMNDAIRMTQAWVRECKAKNADVAWPEVEAYINDTPFKTLSYSVPSLELHKRLHRI